MRVFEARIERYMSDGPGYAGRVDVRLEGERLTVAAGASIYAAAVPFELPPIVTARQAADDDVGFVWSLLGDGPREYLEAPEYVDPGRALVLSFGDGRLGTLVLHGEPTLLSIGLQGAGGTAKTADLEAVPL